MAIIEMNISPEPEWAKKFQEYLETEYNFSKLDAMGTIGVLHQYMRKYKTPIDEDKLDKMSSDYSLALHNKKSNISIELAEGTLLKDDVAQAYKEGYHKGWENKH